MNELFEHAMLYDFYGELLTQNQRNIYEAAFFNDMSMAEIAQEYDISRQCAHEVLKRCKKNLQEYEEKLHLVEKFSKTKAIVGKILELSDCSDSEVFNDYNARLSSIHELAGGIIEEL